MGTNAVKQGQAHAQPTGEGQCWQRAAEHGQHTTHQTYRNNFAFFHGVSSVGTLRRVMRTSSTMVGLMNVFIQSLWRRHTEPAVDPLCASRMPSSVSGSARASLDRTGVSSMAKPRLTAGRAISR